MDLKTARFLTNKTQLDIEAATGVFQTLLSRFENNGIQCLGDDEKKRIESYLRVKINWDPKEGQKEPLTKDEKDEIKPWVTQLMAKKGEREFIEWASSFETCRDFYNGIMDILNSALMRIQIPMPEMDFRKEKRE